MEALTLIGASSFFNDAEFERVFGGTITGLNRVLRSSYAVEKDGLRGPIGKMIARSDVTKIFLECASTNLAGPQAKDVSYKISSAINNKAKKPYCNTSTALFLD